MEDVKTHPVQRPNNWYLNPSHPASGSVVPVVVSMRAYEVYCKLWGPQEALVTGSCRGGFGIGELAALLYARSFPQEEWRQRFDEAITGMKL
jgi:hypothetical protein